MINAGASKDIAVVKNKRMYFEILSSMLSDFDALVSRLFTPLRDNATSWALHQVASSSETSIIRTHNKLPIQKGQTQFNFYNKDLDA
jgi:hypothetical protein